MLDEQDIDRSPMERVRQPKTPTKLIPVIRDEDTRKLLDVCKGKDFASLRGEALIRLYYNTGARLSEVGNLLVDDIDLNTESVHYHGKGAKDRRVRFGAKTARAVSRYLRARAKHKGAELPQLWLAERGGRPLAPNGIKIRLKRLGLAAGVADVHAHRWRHNFAHEWKLAGGNTGDLMLLLGWTSEDMPRHYGASAAAQRGPRKSRRGWESANVSDGPDLDGRRERPAARRQPEPMTAQQRGRRARIAAHASWANTADRAECRSCPPTARIGILNPSDSRPAA